jgi:hypothetical protein
MFRSRGRCGPDAILFIMAALDTVQTFAGITNENEFYSHHYRRGLQR